MDFKGTLQTIKEASIFDIFLISFIALPFLFDAWLRILEKLNADTITRFWSLFFILLFYVVGVISMVVGSSKSKTREIAKDQIINYLMVKELQMMTLSAVRNYINPSYSDEFLNSLPVHFPDQIRRATLKGGNPGLARISDS